MGENNSCVCYEISSPLSSSGLCKSIIRVLLMWLIHCCLRRGTKPTTPGTVTLIWIYLSTLWQQFPSEQPYSILNKHRILRFWSMRVSGKKKSPIGCVEREEPRWREGRATQPVSNSHLGFTHPRWPHCKFHSYHRGWPISVVHVQPLSLTLLDSSLFSVSCSSSDTEEMQAMGQEATCWVHKSTEALAQEPGRGSFRRWPNS